ELLGRGLNNQICCGTLFQVRCSMNPLQRTVAIVFSQLAALNSFDKIAVDRCNSARQRLAIHVVQQDPKPGSRGNLGNAMSHCARADDGNALNRFRTASWAAHLAENRAHTRFDYPNIRSYTIRSTEKAILSASFAVLCVLCVKKGLHAENAENPEKAEN